MFQLSETDKFFGVFLTQHSHAGRAAAIFQNLLKDPCSLALVFEAMHSRPMTTYPKSLHDYPEQYFRSFAQQICLPGSQKKK